MRAESFLFRQVEVLAFQDFIPDDTALVAEYGNPLSFQIGDVSGELLVTQYGLAG